MAFSYLVMSALVAWFSDAPTAPDPSLNADTSEQPFEGDEATPVNTEAEAEQAKAEQAEAEQPEAADPAPPHAPKADTKVPAPAGESKLSQSEQPMPPGLGLGSDKGVLKVVTPDAHTIYVDGEFAGRGPVRIIPLGPGKHSVKTRYEGSEQELEAEVKLGRMTLVSLGPSAE